LITMDNRACNVIKLPYKAEQRIVVFGGHDSWAREIKRMLPGVVFIRKEKKPNTELIRAADSVWIQSNALSHASYSKIINTVRTNRIPVRYFGYASAKKCAEQLVLDNMQAVE